MPRGFGVGGIELVRGNSLFAVGIVINAMN